jgi:hypothetical protein
VFLARIDQRLLSRVQGPSHSKQVDVSEQMSNRNRGQSERFAGRGWMWMLTACTDPFPNSPTSCCFGVTRMGPTENSAIPSLPPVFAGQNIELKTHLIPLIIRPILLMLPMHDKVLPQNMKPHPAQQHLPRTSFFIMPEPDEPLVTPRWTVFTEDQVGLVA